ARAHGPRRNDPVHLPRPPRKRYSKKGCHAAPVRYKNWFDELRFAMIGRSRRFQRIFLRRAVAVLSPASREELLMSRPLPLAFLILALSLNGASAGEDRVRRAVDHPIACLAVSPDGKTLAVGGAAKKGDARDIHQPGTCSLLDVSTGKVVRSIATERAVLAVAFSPDGKRLLLGERDRNKLVAPEKKRSVF